MYEDFLRLDMNRPDDRIQLERLIKDARLLWGAKTKGQLVATVDISTEED